VKRLLSVVVALGLALTACSIHDTREVSLQEATWRRAAVPTYSFTYTDAGQMGPRSHDLHVVDGLASAPAPEGVPATIDDVFRLLEKEKARADKVTATYDDLLGYPTSVNIDEQASAVDDEWGFTITNFRQP